MFILKKTVPCFLTPPGCFVAGLLLAGCAALVTGRRRLAIFCLALGVGMWLPATGPVSNAFMRPLEAAHAVPGDPSGDVIVLLCGGVRRGVPDLTGTGTPSGATLARILDAVRLQRRLQVPVIVSGGSVFGREPSEADIVRRILVDLGVPAGAVTVEDRSRDTFDNARFTSALIAEKGYSRPVLVTSALHLKRAVWCFRAAGREVVPFPADIRTLHDNPCTWRDLLPGSYRGVAAALHEYLGLAYYRLVHGSTG